MSTKITTTEEAEQNLKQSFLDLGLNEDGSIIEENNSNKSVNKFVKQFKGAVKTLDSEDFKAVSSENEELQEEEQENLEEIEDETLEKRRLLQVEAELKSRDETIAKMQKMVNNLSEQTTKQQQAEQTRVLASIESQRKQAVLSADYDAVLKLDQQKAQVLGQSQTLDPVYADFLKRNPWWNGTGPSDIKMRAAANQYDSVIAKQQLTPAQGVALLEECIRNDFPEYFDKSEKKATVAAVEGNIKAGVVKNTKSIYNINNLDKQSKHVIKEFARLGKLKPEDYLKELVKEGLLK